MDDTSRRLQIILPQENVLLPIPDSITYSDGFMKVNSGETIYWQSFLPTDQTSVKGNIFYFHGYADHTSWYIRDHMLRFAIEGYNVYCADYIGHGKSSGLHGYINSFKDIAITMGEFIKHKIIEIQIQKYMFVSESMGSAIACHVWDHYRYDLEVINNGFRGIVMVAPLCGMKEPGIIPETFLNCFSYWFPTSQFIPQAPLNNKSVKNVTVRENGLLNELYFRQPVRNKTAYEILKASRKMSNEIAKISIFTFLIVHGTDDVVTNPAMSKTFFDISPSLNKKYISYEGVWHSMLSGENIETINSIYKDIVQWIELNM